MGNDERMPRDFEATKARLGEIADAVSDESLPLDEALDLFEEAVALGLQATDLLETDIVFEEQREEGDSDKAAEESPQPTEASD